MQPAAQRGHHQRAPSGPGTTNGPLTYKTDMELGGHGKGSPETDSGDPKGAAAYLVSAASFGSFA
ncbi:hypothetical protein GCM10010435_80210 [Winogradskya consettensis]